MSYIPSLKYTSETRSFAFINNRMIGNVTKKVGNFLSGGSDGTAGKITTGLGMAGAAIGLASGGIGMAKMLSDKVQFCVVYKTANGAGKSNVKANNAIDAVNQVRSKVQGGSGFKPFRIPEQESEALEYYQSLQ